MTPGELTDAHESRSLDAYGLIGSRGYQLVGLDRVKPFSAPEIKDGAVEGIEIVGDAPSPSNVFYVDQRRNNHHVIKIHLRSGVENSTIFIGPDCQFICDIHIEGNGSKVFLNGDNFQPGYFRAQLWRDFNTLFIGHRSTTNGNKFVISGEHRSVVLGEDCMLASNIAIQTTDMHNVADIATGLQINHEADVVMEPHVWLGDNVTIGKGVVLGFGSIVGARSLVSKSFGRFSMVGGVPAKLIRSNVVWKRFGEIDRGFVDEMVAYGAGLEERDLNLRR